MDSNWKKTLADGTEVIRTCAWSPPGCHAVGCGLRLYVKDGKLMKVEGDPEQPVTRGRTCIRCLTLPEYMYHKDRLLYPMKRDPKDRGKDTWERISWDEALELAGKHIHETQEKYGLEGTCLFLGTGRQSGGHFTFHCYNILQSPNACYAFSGYSCYGPRIAVASFVLGAGVCEMDFAAGYEQRYDDPRFEVPKYVLVWGKDPLKSNPDGLWGHCLIELMRLGAKLIVVDPRMTWLASRAEYTLRLRPGTDGALALGLLNVIISEDIYDHDFVDKWCYGFEELAEQVKNYPPEMVAKITDVPIDKIYGAARAMAQKPTSLTWGVAIDCNNNGIQAGQAVMAIQAITGNIDIPGGTVLGKVALQEGMVPPSDVIPTNCPPEVMVKKIGSKKYPAFDMIVNTVQPDNFLEALENDDPYPIRFAWIQSSNFLSPTCSVQPQRWYNAVRKMDYIMATDVFMNPTIMALADLVLPVATFAEGDGAVSNHYGMNTQICSAINKAVEVGEAKSDIEIGLLLGRVLNPDKFSGDLEEMKYAYLDDKTGQFSGGDIADWHELRTEGSHLIPIEYYKYEKGMLRPDGKLGFNTPTGRIELYSTTYKRFGEEPLPYYIEPHMSPTSTPQYEFVLTTGARQYAYFHSEQRQVASLRDINPDPIIEMNPVDAAKHGIEDSSWIEISNVLGKAQLKAHITPIVKPGVLHAYHGWWFPEQEGEEPNLFGVWRSNLNLLCPSGDNSRIGFGAPLKCMMCNVHTLDGRG